MKVTLKTENKNTANKKTKDTENVIATQFGKEKLGR